MIPDVRFEGLSEKTTQCNMFAFSTGSGKSLRAMGKVLRFGKTMNRTANAPHEMQKLLSRWREPLEHIERY